MTKTTRCAAYVRCSTSHQDTEMQTRDLKEYAERRGWSLTLYEDRGVSGGKDSRPALDRLMDDARKGKLDVVVVWRFDRFGRSLKHLVDALAEFGALGIEFVSYCESIDTSTPTGRVLFAVIAAIAEFERALIQERVRAGVALARSKGKHVGRPRKGFDFRKALELRQGGASLRQIARQMGVSPSTIHRLVDCA